MPDYLREARTITYSIGQPSPNACLPFENGPPYESYITSHVYFRTPSRPYGFDRRILGDRWVSQAGGMSDATFRRGDASLYVSQTNDATTFALDHRGYARVAR